MDSLSSGIRRKALQKIAALSATSSKTTEFRNSDLERLCNACPPHQKSSDVANGYLVGEKPSLGGIAMSIKEFEVLLALCKAAPLVEDYKSAEKLAIELAPYTREAHTQIFLYSPFFREITPSPIESLSYNLTSALLSLGINHDGLQDKAAEYLISFLDRCAYTSKLAISSQEVGNENETDMEDATNVARLAISLLGFLDAAATYAHFWSPVERLSLIVRIKEMLSEKLLISVETAFSKIRNSHSTDGLMREWKRYVRHYAVIGRPLGAMLLQRSFMSLLVASTSLLVTDITVLRGRDILDLMISGELIPKRNQSSGGEDAFASVETIAAIAAEEMEQLEDGADYLRLGSAWQQRLAFSVKASALISYLNCVILNDEAEGADADTLVGWLEEALDDPIQMADESLASVVLRCMALAARLSPEFAPNMSKRLPRFIVQRAPRGETVIVASNCLAFVLRLLSQDAVISTLYTLGNVLTRGTNAERVLASAVNGELLNNSNLSAGFYSGKQNSSAISLTLTGEEETTAAHGNVVQAIRIIASSCKDENITALAQSMLLQKINKVSKSVDANIIYEAAVLAVTGGPMEFRSLLKFYGKLTQEGVAEHDDELLFALRKTRNYLSSTLRKGTAMYDIYLENLLEAIISRGDVRETNHTRESDVELAAQEIAQLLQPLAILMAANNLAEDKELDEEIVSLFRDAWFNMLVHGFSTSTERGKKYINELRVLAIHSRPLVTEQRSEQLESDIEVNPVLRRGINSEHEATQKKRLTALIPSKASEIRSLSYRKIIFLHTAYVIETLRAESGDCTKALKYFLEPGMRTGDMSSVMEAITVSVVDIYLRKTLTGTNPTFSAPYVAKQLVSIFCDCCHRIERVQQAAILCADRILHAVTSSLCQKTSLFALLELLSLMWISCLEAETDEYEWKSSFTSVRGKVTVQLSDNFELRRRTLNTLYRNAKQWVMQVIDIAPLDVKGLLQTYLSEYDDDGAYGHISLGRSFAVEMGSVVPRTDQKLGAIDRHGDTNINAASDFIAQYTTRQEYRYAEALPDHDAEWLNLICIDRRGSFSDNHGEECADTLTALERLETRMLAGKFIPLGELRDLLRRAAALLCRSKEDECAIVKYLVGIPFAHLTKQSIKLGISLWLGVINENPRMQPRILIELAHQWENTIHRKQGIFNDHFIHIDPFYNKAEFAPSDREALSKRQQIVHNLLAPHFRLLQFLSSHFSATRLCSPHLQKTFIRMLRATLHDLKHSNGHPLARELHFSIVLFGLRVLKYSAALSSIAQWRLKSQLVSAALSWFSFAPRWSFGGNRLQIKAETRLLSDVAVALKNVEHIGAHDVLTLKSFQPKEELLQALLENEQARMKVWLNPMNDVKDPCVTNVQSQEPPEATLVRLVKTAWNVNVSVAIHMTMRYRSARLHREVRDLILNHPQKVINEPEALQIMLGGSLPADVTFQLKYLLYWAPVNPITAVTYFLPAYGNHPFIVQYAMRALESHVVEVTFFYVPQIVQSLRYDALGYVERYIIETAKFSQLFAHQIIWNMKANAFKDEDSQIPDAIKPTLDKVMSRMILSFSGEDRVFYEREFSFFDEVTSISGKLKPYIKRPKPEKKQKIEEELRKIKVAVGVYLPSNPDGVVIGIDRKSGKPLQSHAKAPYMATFRIQKNISSVEETEDTNEEINKIAVVPIRENKVEIWQSAIFKVGDDCRQDVLALQMIAAFRGIFNNVGLDVYVFPYRVTATAPGCGVIDVLPNSISRDMLGREAVNGLYDYFISKYGNEDSVRFQEARNNFVKSMAAYSIISYLLQFKDRHNGNIMIDDAGHILHIDFGFCFDIAPGGVKFERAPFKLTTEMVAVMGGNSDHQAYKWFEELCIKAFLASRQYVDKLSQIVLLMMDSGLPCFKPETIQHFKERFVLEKSEREAANFMKDLIKKSHSSYSTGVYDQFQLWTNGIPY